MMKKTKIKLWIVIFLLSAALLFSCYMVISELMERSEAAQEFTALAELTIPNQQSKTITLAAPEPAIKPDEQLKEDETAAVPRRDFAALFEQNSECVGWICIPDTAIDYPVMHTPASPQKYLKLDFYGERSSAGVPFLDGRCSLDGDNLILYGHSMKDGSMFRSLFGYVEQDYQEKHSVIQFDTADGDGDYTVFAVVYTDKADEWYGYLSAGTAEEFAYQIEKIKNRSTYDTGITPEYGQRILTLSTCYGSGKDGRLLVIAAANTRNTGGFN